VKTFSHITLTAGAAALVLAAVAPGDAAAQSPAKFYKGKTVTIGVGSGTGGSIDLNARIIVRHLTKHFPGNPNIIVQNVPGAGSVKLANLIFKKAKTDGTYIGALNRSALFNKIYYGKKSKALYGPNDLVQLGSPNKIWSVAYAWHTQPVKNVEDLRTKQLIVGGSGGTTIFTPEMHKSFSGLKFKVIRGYKSGSSIDHAAEKGEVGGRASATPANLIDYGWVKNKKVNILFWNGLERDTSFSDAPLGLDLVKKKADRKLMELFFGADEMGYPYVVSRKVPKDRVAAIAKALLDTFRDPGYVKDLAKARLETHPVSPERMTEIVKTAYSSPKAMIARLQDVLAADHMKRIRAKKKK
jgi:hypothetical protein